VWWGTQISEHVSEQIIRVGWDWVHLVRRPLFGLMYQPRMMDKYGAFGGMRIGRGNRSTRRKPATVPLRSPQIPNDVPLHLTRRLTAWAMARSVWTKSSLEIPYTPERNSPLLWTAISDWLMIAMTSREVNRRHARPFVRSGMQLHVVYTPFLFAYWHMSPLCCAFLNIVVCRPVAKYWL
jgi:hypothetical protein